MTHTHGGILRGAAGCLCALLLGAAVGLASAPAPACAHAVEGALHVPDSPASESSFPTVEGEVVRINGYGDLVLSVSRQDIFAASYLITDTVAFEVRGERFIMPLVSAQLEGMPGCPLLIAEESGDVRAGIMYGRLSEEGGLAGVVQPGDAVTISMVRRGGFAATHACNALVRTYEREDYDSDEAYANYRVVSTTGMGKGALVRSSTPIDDAISRDGYAAELDSATDIRCVLNFTNTPDDARQLLARYEPNTEQYRNLYDQGLVYADAVDTHLGSEPFREGLAGELRFMAEHEGPYLLHCVEGKDRTGLACMLLEALVGATYDEIAADYLQTFVNYYHVQPGSRQYDVLQAEYVDRFLLKIITGVGDRQYLASADLEMRAVAYLQSLGLTNDEIAALRMNLRKDYTS